MESLLAQQSATRFSLRKGRSETTLRRLMVNMEIGPIVTRFPWIYIRVKKCNSIRAFYLKLLLKITFSRSTFVCMVTLDIIYIPKYSVRRRTCSWAIWVLRPTTNTRFFCMTRTWARRSRFNSTEAIVGATAGFGFDTEPKIYIVLFTVFTADTLGGRAWDLTRVLFLRS